MKKIMLVCNEGMSTGVLTQKMQMVAEEHNLEVDIRAVPEASVEREWRNSDVILLGPQIGYLEDNIKEIVDGNKPVSTISAVDYGRINGKAVLKKALDMIKEFENK